MLSSLPGPYATRMSHPSPHGWVHGASREAREHGGCGSVAWPPEIQGVTLDNPAGNHTESAHYSTTAPALR
jgi:hypothetical protein